MMEPEAKNICDPQEGPGAIALTSIAISMKRIADVLEGDATQGSFFQQADGWFHHWLGTWMRSR